ncbi:MAG: hypothetical protein P5702_15330 [Limnospira sp. PMC 1291.21]|uniref:Uncharacterized protein n=1 Tax=Limnospira fusiformis PMC 851.14 TaxID=2219512 RepID=A0ABU9ESM3_LIMFS|nr:MULTISPECIES: hypothetical protein [Limnospira]MDT9178848.1 hypothetical protein [Limnospira sp. PMC 1238.20]MDT9275940.1 hypothetical protein [Limnospira sp. PMC 737.11]MDT9306663.1 hypothetical protein [Limnospira sp. PMC 1291.21]QJB26376.1 hypothetical protein HFV01_11890 [Limnospira fusiformis SAG 85.79]QNH55585.1 MAG: hypothetical protein H2674_14060 [Limnospira indica BM01]
MRIMRIMRSPLNQSQTPALVIKFSPISKSMIKSKPLIFIWIPSLPEVPTIALMGLTFGIRLL